MQSTYRNLVDDLHLMIVAESEADSLSSLNTRTIDQAQAALCDLENEIRQTHNVRLYEPYDALADHLGTLATFRIKKMMGLTENKPLENSTDAEAQFHSSLVELVSSLRTAWGLKD